MEDWRDFVSNEYINEVREVSARDQEVLMPMIVGILKNRVGENARISNREIVAVIRGRGYKTDTSKVRLLIRLIRISGQVRNLCGSTNGYWVAGSLGEMKRYMDSNLRPRWRKVLVLYMAMKTQLEDMGGKGDEVLMLSEWEDMT
ncbi:MAG: hypothetical protein WC222_11205 [Parachlamydiales bacterium]|jgi:hypothetical protein